MTANLEFTINHEDYFRFFKPKFNLTSKQQEVFILLLKILDEKKTDEVTSSVRNTLAQKLKNVNAVYNILTKFRKAGLLRKNTLVREVIYPNQVIVNIHYDSKPLPHSKQNS